MPLSQPNLIIEKIANMLVKQNLHISIAESCTGGLLSYSFVSIPGASSYFNGSIVAYNDNIKESILGIDPFILKRFTSVSEIVATEMALSVCKIFHSEIAISTTGVAGPGIDKDNNPEGLVFIAIVINEKIYTKKLLLNGERNKIINRVIYEALNFLYTLLKKTLNIT